MTARIIFMTGASGGLAQAIVTRLAENDHLILAGRSKEKLEKLYAHRPNTTCLALDLTDDAALEEVVETIYRDFGRLDILINNAGYGSFKAFDAYDSREVRDMFDVNTFASMTLARLIGRKMAEQGSGHIVNIVSMAGLIASSKSSIYAASKFAVIGFSNALRLELTEQGVYVTTVNPGPIATSFFDTADPTGNYLKSVGRYVLTADQVAKKTVACLGKNKRELNLPFALAAAHKAYTLFPKTADFFARKVFNYK